jgi:glycosyltransferase involved in cell wall biosynthesis
MKAGGAEKVIFETISALDREKYSPSIAWFKDHDLVDDFSKITTSMHFIPKIKRFDIKTITQLARVIKLTNANIVNAHHFMPLFYSYFGYLISKKVKLIYTEHSAWEVTTGSNIWDLIKKYILKNSDAIIGVSDEISTKLINKYQLNANKVYTITNGVNINNYTNTKQYNIDVDFPPNAIKIVMVANFRKNKNHVFMIKAFSELYHKNNNVHLIFIGQGFIGDPENSENEIHKALNEFNISRNVSILGYRPNVNELISMMDIACLCSDKEGLPMSLIEAMAAGLPIVGTNVEGIRDVIIDNYNGYLINKGDSLSFSHYLNILSSDQELRKLFGKRSREIVINRYNIEKSARSFEELLTKLSHGNKGN